MQIVKWLSNEKESNDEKEAEGVIFNFGKYSWQKVQNEKKESIWYKIQMIFLYQIRFRFISFWQFRKKPYLVYVAILSESFYLHLEKGQL